LWGVIATDQALHFSILAVGLYGWRLDDTSPAWRATEGEADHGAPPKVWFPMTAGQREAAVSNLAVLLGAWLKVERRTAPR
jgi:hypothetical protein